MKSIVGIMKSILKNKLFLFLVFLAIVGVVFLKTGDRIKQLFTKPQKPQQVEEVEAEALPVKVYKIKRIDFKDTLPLLGTLKGFREIELRFPIGGVMESFNFNEGEEIKEGDIIASLEQKDAILKLKYSEVELNKNQKLFDIGSIAKPKLEQAKLEYESAKSDFDKTNIYAVSDGLMGRQNKQVGEYVAPSDKIGTFIDIQSVYAEFGIIEKDISRVRLGQKTEVYADAYPGNTYNGEISILAPMIEGRSKTLTSKVELKNPDMELKPGMFVRATVYTYEKEKALIIPVSALQTKENVQFVYVVHKAGGAAEGSEGLNAEQPEAKLIKQPDAEEAQAGDDTAAREVNLDDLAGGMQMLQGGAQKKTNDSEEAPQASAPEEPQPEMGEVEIRQVKIAYASSEAVEIEEGLQEGEFVIIELEEELQDKAKVEIVETRENLL